MDQTFFDVFSRLKRFLKSDDIRIQFETVASLTYIFNHKWMSDEVPVGNDSSSTDILQRLYDAVRASFPESSSVDDLDKKSSDLAVRAQFHGSIVASCFCLRKENWFRLFEHCCISMTIRKGKMLAIEFRLKEADAEKYFFSDLIMKMVAQICESTLHTTHIDALKKTIPYLIAKWIQNNYAINSFPWYFTRSESHNDFLLDENECIAVAVLRHAPNLLSEYVQMMRAESLESILRDHEVSRFH